jgi:hypothetical protein
MASGYQFQKIRRSMLRTRCKYPSGQGGPHALVRGFEIATIQRDKPACSLGNQRDLRNEPGLGVFVCDQSPGGIHGY